MRSEMEMSRRAPKGSNATVALLLLLGLTAACARAERDPLQAQAVLDGAAAYEAERDAWRARQTERILARAFAVVRGETRDDTLDLLSLSGGADWGAFGAGYLARWNEQGDAAAIPMPEFDIIAGISTGSLIGTYVAAQTPERFAGIEEFYRTTRTDWVTFRGLSALLPSSPSVLDNSGVRDEVRAALDDALIADLREAYTDGRVVIAATTNLDFGRLEYWELGAEAHALAEPQDRLVDILMAATAIPGAFPPVLIDGNLHADGGAVQGVPAIDPVRLPAFGELWRQRHPDLDPPLIRFWFVYNNQLGLQPDPVDPGWFDIVFRSYQTISQTSFKAPVQASLLASKAAASEGAPPFEVRWLAIPDDFVPEPDVQPFDPRTTNALADIGRKVADSPGGGWDQTFPN